MNDRGFVDYYEVLQLSSNANTETVERVYRLLAKRYHPDNQATGDASRFTEVREAYDVLSDPDKRAAYDGRYEENRSRVWDLFEQASAYDGPDQDRRVFHGILSLLYVARRRDVRHPGLGPMYMEKMLGCPMEHLEFPIWYLKQRQWVEVLENGQLAITADGVDKLGDKEFELRTDRLLGKSDLAETADDTGPTAASDRKVASDSGSGTPPEADAAAGSGTEAPPEEEDVPEANEFLDEAFADNSPPRARA